MSSVPVSSQLEILDLRHFSARQLRPLLEREAETWRARLRWDYSSSTELLLQYLDSRILQGLVALDRGRICGYTFCVYEGHKAVIGDAFSLSHSTHQEAETTALLLTRMLETLRHSPAVDRIEAQLLLYDQGVFAEVFRGPEHTVYPRLFLECALRGPVPAGAAASAVQREVPAELELACWSAHDYQAAGELIHACYAGHQDAQINDQYRSLHGSLRFLHNIVRFPGCGVFEGNFSFVLRRRIGGGLAGVVLVSRVGPRVGHITQLCVAPEYRGRGLGWLLLDRCASSLRLASFEAITLTVTESNDAAVQLYRRLGFRVRHRFDAMVVDNRYRPA